MGGNVGANKPLSEYMSLILEPVAKRMEGMEINASSGLLSVIESLNDELSTRTEEIEKNGTTSNTRGDRNIILDTIEEELERISSLEEGEEVQEESSHLEEEGPPQSPKTLTASGSCQDQNTTNMKTGDIRS